MCIEPVSTLLLIGTAVSVGSQIYSGVQTQKAAQTQAAVQVQQAEQQAVRSEAQTVVREEKGVYDTEQQARQFTRQLGTNTAGAASTGIDIRSFADVFADDSAEAELESRAIRYGATRDAENMREQSKIDQSRAAASANALRTSGNNAMVGSVFSAVGAGFNGLAKARSVKYSSYAEQ